MSRLYIFIGLWVGPLLFSQVEMIPWHRRSSYGCAGFSYPLTIQFSAAKRFIDVLETFPSRTHYYTRVTVQYIHVSAVGTKTLLVSFGKTHNDTNKNLDNNFDQGPTECLIW